MLLKRCGELQPGMVIAKDVHTKSGLLLLNSGEEVTADSIEKLKNNDVSFVFIKDKKDFEKKPEKPVSYSDERYSYYERVQQSQDYKVFRGKFSSGVVKLRGTLNRIVDGNPDADLETTARKIMGDLVSLQTYDVLMMYALYIVLMLLCLLDCLPSGLDVLLRRLHLPRSVVFIMILESLQYLMRLFPNQANLLMKSLI